MFSHFDVEELDRCFRKKHLGDNGIVLDLILFAFRTRHKSQFKDARKIL